MSSSLHEKSFGPHLFEPATLISKNHVVMRVKLILPVGLVLIVSCQNESKVKVKGYTWPEGVAAPVAEKKVKELSAHGDVRTDNYYWMNDYFKKGPDSTKVVEYLKAENAYLDTMLSGAKDLREKLFVELKARIKEKDESVPYKENGYWYYYRFEEGKQYRVFCRKKEALNAPEEIIHDANKAAEGPADNNEPATMQQIMPKEEPNIGQEVGGEGHEPEAIVEEEEEQSLAPNLDARKAEIRQKLCEMLHRNGLINVGIVAGDGFRHFARELLEFGYAHA